MSGTSHFVSEPGSEGEHFSRFVSLLGVAPCSPATFSVAPGGIVSSAWELWQENIFLPLLAPAFIDAFRSGSLSQVDALESNDLALGRQLSDSAKARSILAAKPFFAGKREMRGHRVWRRFAERVEQGSSPGHISVVFALHTQLYHLPLPTALATYAWFEFQSRHGKSPFPAMTEEENAVFSTVLPRIPLAVRQKTKDYGDGSEMLRVI